MPAALDEWGPAEIPSRPAKLELTIGITPGFGEIRELRVVNISQNSDQADAQQNAGQQELLDHNQANQPAALS